MWSKESLNLFSLCLVVTIINNIYIYILIIKLILHTISTKIIWNSGLQIMLLINIILNHNLVITVTNIIYLMIQKCYILYFTHTLYIWWLTKHGYLMIDKILYTLVQLGCTKRYIFYNGQIVIYFIIDKSYILHNGQKFIYFIIDKNLYTSLHKMLMFLMINKMLIFYK